MTHRCLTNRVEPLLRTHGAGAVIGTDLAGAGANRDLFVRDFLQPIAAVAALEVEPVIELARCGERPELESVPLDIDNLIELGRFGGRR